MASPIEESFVRDRLTGKTVFEFGCFPGKFSTELSNLGYKVTGVDLYKPDFVSKYTFIQGDFVDLKVEGIFDNIVAISSLEHCGIESKDFWEPNKNNLIYHTVVADRISQMIFPASRLLVTVPFGLPGAVYYVDKNGNNGVLDEIKEPIWGYRTFNVDSISNLFFNLNLTECKAYGRFGDNHFNIDSWEEVDSNDYSNYNNKNIGVLCCMFRGEKL